MSDLIVTCPPPPPPVPTDSKPKCRVPVAPVVPVSETDEARDACRRRGLCLPESGYTVRLHRVSPVLQTGPTCGPVALAMLLRQPVEPLVSLARKRGFTNNGEMFSCGDMAALASAAAADLRVTHHHGNLCSHGAVQELLDGVALLVPYDADFNHAPCLRRGHKAHWALIVGAVVNEASADVTECTLVLARHGKSAHLAAWSLRELADSNANLVEFPPHRDSDGLTYVLPPGGVGGDQGLRSQFISLRWSS